jgi:hypothetical protein
LEIHNLLGNTHLTVDDTGSRIWESLAAPIRVAGPCKRLATEYNRDLEQIENGVLVFLGRLAGDGLDYVVAD